MSAIILMPQNRWKVVQSLRLGGTSALLINPLGRCLHESSNNKYKKKKKQEKNQLQPPPKYISQVGLCVGSINFRATILRRVRACARMCVFACLCVRERERENRRYALDHSRQKRTKKAENWKPGSGFLFASHPRRFACSTFYAFLCIDPK